MNRKLIFGVVLVLFLMGIPESLLALGPAQAAPSTVLYIEPSSIVDLNLIPGHNFTIDLMVADVEYLFAWQANITFDPSVIEFLNVTEGGFLQDQPEGSFFAYVVENATDGWILIGATTLGPYQGASGSGTLAVIEFHVLTYGESTIHIVTEPKWYDWNENGIIDPGELIYTTILQGQNSPIPPPNFYDIEFIAEDGYFANEAFETIYIRSDGSIDPPTAPIVRDGDLYTLVGDIFSETDGIVIERGDMTLDGGGYRLVGADDLFSKGIISYSDNLTIRNLEVRDFPWGIDLESSSSHIFGNNVSGCKQSGISLYGSSNEVYGNNVTDCQDGISLYLSPGSSIYGNNVESINHYHISLSGCSNSSVYGNTILNGLFGGFYLGDSENCTVYGNSLVENYMYGIVVIRAINNVIYHNNIINSTTPVYSSDSANAWDNGYPSGGNYWSDYTGIDSFLGPSQNFAGSDGIGDTPYIIDANNTDGYPLMAPYVEGNLSMSVYTDKDVYSIGETMHVGLDIINPDSVKYQCFVLVLELPDGTLYPVIHQHSVVLSIGMEYSNPSFNTFILPSLPVGTYTWHVAILDRTTHMIVVHDTAQWVFS